MHSTIVTQRLVLHRPVMEELNEYYALFSRPEVHVYNPAGPDTDISQTEQTLRSWIEDWERDGVGYYTVRLHEELGQHTKYPETPESLHKQEVLHRQDASHEQEVPDLVGYVGVAKRPFDTQTSVLNLAYRIHPEHQGIGLVTEACRAVLQAAQVHYPNMQIRAYTKAENYPSRNVAERLGFTYRPELDNYPESGDVNYFL